MAILSFRMAICSFPRALLSFQIANFSFHMAISSSKRLPALQIVASWRGSCGVPPWFGHFP